ncbi:hypothetical protein [Paenibacillus hexagrammi]|uniref:DUF2798 domain-containing protein n=1 Tax=Paenibacillus hexagrammi TaxID=2908839 RepID=A0ABY3SJG4_9BACL|nr:hypothetical protein [Paenibacillus sp. YPD9-1]UJF33948.1 hypothetical protein L0M14_01470 [Paenibacillus sp. YPD9-1]
MYFGLMMCSGMVIGMTFYNLWTHGLIGSVPVTGILLQLLLGFLIAFSVESFIVGPAAKKLVLSLPLDPSKKGLMILSISVCMVIGMVLCMSIYGLAVSYLMNHQLEEKSLLADYVSLVGINFIFALPLQLIVVGPIVRLLFVTFIKNKAAAGAAAQ